jgi:AcrR family transcriptional regulator
LILAPNTGILSAMTISAFDPAVKAARRRRRSPAEMRAVVMRAARELLRADGPQAITLKAVALRAGVTHGNVTYHFGTVDDLHAALITGIIEDLTLATADAVSHLRRGELGPRDVVNVVFDAFAADGAGRLVAWLVATGAGHRLTPLYAIIAELIGDLAGGAAGSRAGGIPAIAIMMAGMVVPALGDALIGPGLTEALALAPDALRQAAADQLASLQAKHGTGGPTVPPRRWPHRS